MSLHKAPLKSTSGLSDSPIDPGRLGSSAEHGLLPCCVTCRISDIITGAADASVTAREALLKWAQRTTERYTGVRITDFTSSWRDGLAFNAILHRNRPDILDFKSLRSRKAKENLELAFSIAEKEFGITRLLDPEDVDTPEPDEKSLITYISSLYDVFPEPPAYHPFADDDTLFTFLIDGISGPSFSPITISVEGEHPSVSLLGLTGRHFPEHIPPRRKNLLQPDIVLYAVVKPMKKGRG
ncbi:plectin [Trichonephila clavipes]|nr:plectin [Trichonephila clavipes]